MGKIRHKWDESQMKQAINQVLLKKLTIRQASERFTVPKSTLGDRIKSLSQGQEVEMKPDLGSLQLKRTFDDYQEQILYDHVKDLDSQLMPLSKDEFLSLAYQYAEALKLKTRFNKAKKKAGKDFYYEFMKRYPDLSLRTAQSTSLQRAAGFSKEQTDRFFDKLAVLVEKYKFVPSKIFNADETGVTCVHTNRFKVMSVKGKKQVGKLTTAERGRNVTLLLSINAAGDMFIPPLFVFPRVRMDIELTKDAPLGSVFDAQPSGWITTCGFLKWLKLFESRVKPSEESPALLIVDGHASHKDLEVITFAKDHHIHMLSLPPHTSHKLQPLDRTVMKPFKNGYNEASSLWMRQYPNMKITLRDMAGLVNKAFSKICRMELAQSGFKCTGIFPLDRNVFSDFDFAPSLGLNTCDERPVPAPPMLPLGENTGPSRQLLDADAGPSRQIRDADAESSMQLPNADNGPSRQLPDEDTQPSRQCLQHADADLNNDALDTNLLAGSSSLNESRALLEKLSPLPSSSNTKFVTRQNRSEKSEILTSTPYKVQLEDKKLEKELKERKAAERKRLMEEKRRKRELEQNKKKRNLKTKIARPRPSKEEKVKKKTVLKKATDRNVKQNAKRQLQFEEGRRCQEEEVHCIICDETFQENWIQCSVCMGWAHENCAQLEDSPLYYKCDVCVGQETKKKKL